MSHKSRMPPCSQVVQITAMMSGAFLACLSLGAAVAAPATQQSATQLSQCAGDHDESADEIIAACTALIESGQVDGKDLSRIYDYRAVGYEEKDNGDDLARALADARRALTRRGA